jgi:hypothetical protein
MNSHKYSSLSGVAVLVPILFGSNVYARDWSLSKDTAYEWPSSDTVLLTNQGTDTLRFDSIGMELIRPIVSRMEIIFHKRKSAGAYYYYDLAYYQGQTFYRSDRPNTLIISPGEAAPLDGYAIDPVLNPVVNPSIMSKSTVAEMIGDTLVVRLIFIASANRGRDTLVLIGKQDYPDAIGFGKRNPLKPSDANNLFDPLGRRQKIFGPGRVFFPVPLLSPWE